MDDQTLLRYSRHILLNEFGTEAQEALCASRVLVIGAGGLGSAALLYLASAGVGHIVVADGDDVDFTNLQRQIIHGEDSIGTNKARSAARTLRRINSSITVEPIAERLGRDMQKLVAGSDAVLDCSDNFATRHAVNRACFETGTPLVSGAAIRFDGQITSFDFRQAGSACYHCLFPDATVTEEERCAVMGVFAPLVGIIGSMQAAEAIHLLTNTGHALLGRLMMLDARGMEWQTVRYSKDQRCDVCSAPRTWEQKEKFDEVA
jgi:adenylyltransferase/sulfurtransferase